jgi:anti-sigma factor RsiW
MAAAPHELHRKVAASLSSLADHTADVRLEGSYRDWARLARFRRPWVSELGAAAAAVTILVGGYFIAQSFSARYGPDKFAEDFRRAAVTQVVLPGLDAETVARFYQRELGQRIVPVALEEAQLTRATVCDLEGRRGSMVEYDLAGIRLAHYRIPDSSGTAPAGSERFQVASDGGLNVARWHDGRYEHALVAEIPARQLARIAEEKFLIR